MAVTAVSVAALVSAVMPASPAAAAGYRCTTSSHELDTPQYSGPWPDNWKVKSTLCARRSGSWVYAYARVSWDGPNSQKGGGYVNAGYFQLKSKRFYGIGDRWDRSDRNGNYNSSFTTSVIKWKAGRSRASATGALALDWKDDGKGYRRTAFKASPRV